MKIAGIYRILLVSDGRCYVGQSVHVEKRWNMHRRMLRANRHHSRYLQYAWNKHGADAFVFEVLETCERVQLTEREQHWMDALNTVFNVCEAADSSLGYRHTPEALEKMRQASLSASEETRAKQRAALVGRPVSAERRRKLAEANRQRVWTPEAREKVAAARRGRSASPEVRAKLSASRTGVIRGPYKGRTEYASKSRRARITPAGRGPLPQLSLFG